MASNIEAVLAAAQRAEEQLLGEAGKLRGKLEDREREAMRAQAILKVLEEKRFVADLSDGRVSQPPIFFSAWSGVIGRMQLWVRGAEEGALAPMYASFESTLRARSAAHRAALTAAVS